jgi:transcriptional antiterminator RfaH
MSYWAVCQCEPQKEHTVRTLLMRGGETNGEPREPYVTYCPRIKIKTESHRPPRIALLFPTYIFVRIIERWYPVRWTMGVTRILMKGDEPARVPDGVVDMIRSREWRGFVRLPPKYPQIGQPVKILRGTFQDRIAIHAGMNGTDRQRVLLDLLGQKVTVELPRRDVAPLEL